MNCEICNGCGWRVIERAGLSGVKRCDCRKIVEAVEEKTPLTNNNAAVLTKMLFDGLNFAPQSPTTRAAIAMALMEMCGTVEALTYVVETSLKLHSKWPGLPGLRQILTHRYEASDGVSFGGFSEEYPEGIGEA